MGTKAKHRVSGNHINGNHVMTQYIRFKNPLHKQFEKACMGMGHFTIYMWVSEPYMNSKFILGIFP